MNEHKSIAYQLRAVFEDRLRRRPSPPSPSAARQHDREVGNDLLSDAELRSIS